MPRGAGLMGAGRTWDGFCAREVNMRMKEANFRKHGEHKRSGSNFFPYRAVSLSLSYYKEGHETVLRACDADDLQI